MVQLASLARARDQIRSDTNYDDADLTLTIEAASEAVLNYIDDHTFLNSAGEADFDSDDEPVDVPAPIQKAVLMIVAMLYTDRDGEDFRKGETAPRLGDIILPRAVHFLLDRYRIPTIG